MRRNTDKVADPVVHVYVGPAWGTTYLGLDERTTKLKNTLAKTLQMTRSNAASSNFSTMAAILLS